MLGAQVKLAAMEDSDDSTGGSEPRGVLTTNATERRESTGETGHQWNEEGRLSSLERHGDIEEQKTGGLLARRVSSKSTRRGASSRSLLEHRTASLYNERRWQQENLEGRKKRF